jgi:hypothetical protein
MKTYRIEYCYEDFCYFDVILEGEEITLNRKHLFKQDEDMDETLIFNVKNLVDVKIESHQDVDERIEFWNVLLVPKSEEDDTPSLISFMECVKKDQIDKIEGVRQFVLSQNESVEDYNHSDNIIEKTSSFDSDGNGEVDLVEGDDFNQLLKKHQKRVIEINRDYIQQFVKISNLLKTKKKNIQSLFENIKNTSHQSELEEHTGILKNEIHNYQLLLFNSLNMIVSLVGNDMITFYNIYESFDKLRIFNSTWENEVSQKLTNIEDGLTQLLYSIDEMSQSIVSGLSELTYVTEESNRNLINQLGEIESSIQVNNLLTGIQTYQMYKINQNTKGLRE